MKKTALSVLNYQASNIPSFEDKVGQKWVDCGSDNLYPYYLEELYTTSSIHGAVVKGIADMIYGNGLDSETKDKHVEEWLKLQKLFGDGTCLKRACFDLKLYGTCYLNPIWSEDRTTIAEVHHVSANNVRAGKADETDKIKEFYFSPKWEKANEPAYTPQAIPAFSTDDRSAASQILQIKLYNPISFFYGLPDYVGSTNYIELDRDISEFHLNNIKNGLFPSMMISFNNGVPSDEERLEIERGLYQKFGGAQNSGKLMISFNDSAEDAPRIEPITISDPHRIYEYLSSEVVVKILSGHRVTSPLLFGIRNEGGGFGSNADEMRDAYDLLQNTVIQDFQDVMLKGLRPILSAASFTLPLHFGKYYPANFLKEEEKKNTSSPDPLKLQFSKARSGFGT